MLSMKKAFVILASLLSVILIINAVEAESIPKPYDMYVNDYAHIFSAPDTSYLQALLNEVQQNTTAQVVIVTLQSLNGSDISQYTTDLGQAWGVGNKDNSNGFVILYSAEENKIFAASGYGLEGILPDSKIGRLLDENYVPLKNSGNVSEGIIKFTEAISQVIEQNADEVKSNQSQGQGAIGIIPIVLGLFIFFFFIALISYPFTKRKGGRGFGDFWTFFFIDFLVRSILFSIIFRGGRGRSSGGSNFGGGFGGGGFGGGGFGGGGFGGGGAGR